MMKMIVVGVLMGIVLSLGCWTCKRCYEISLSHVIFKWIGICGVPVHCFTI